MGSGIVFEDRGSKTLKGVPGEWRLFAVQTRGEQPAVMAVGDEGQGLPKPEEHFKRTDRARIALATRLPKTSRAVSRLAMHRLARR